MSTAAQIAANQANAQHSTGPRTDPGKAASAKNAASHGLASHTILSYEDPERFNTLVGTIAAEFHPQSDTESFLVFQMAQARWRIHRIGRLITATFDSLIDAADPDCPDVRLAQSMARLGDDPVAKLQRYLTEAERSFYKAKRELENAQKAAQNGKNETKPIRLGPDPEPEEDEHINPEIYASIEAFCRPPQIPRPVPPGTAPNSSAGSPRPAPNSRAL